jgi:predicted acylesterase/phospholipase RssA
VQAFLTPALGGGTIGRPSTREVPVSELTAEIENGPWPQEPAEVCDLVMKGGVASGVVYPGAILALAKRYRFRNVGGTSAGAIAATVTAAAELGRRERGDGGFQQLRRVADEICEPGRVRDLFQPGPENRRVFDLAMQLLEAKAKGAGARRRVVTYSLRALWLPIVLLALGWTAAVSVAGYALYLWLGWWSALAWPALAASAAVGIAFLGACAVTLTVARPGLALARTLGDRDAGFGLCPGTTQDGFEREALSDWLHEHIQRCAGRTTKDAPLTFADLKAAEDDSLSVLLQLMTTDVSAGRPVRLPLPDENPFYFDVAELGEVVPASVAEWMRKKAGPAIPLGERKVYKAPGESMPVLLATRMSLAVPGLLASVPFYERREDAEPEWVEHWFSDGAVTSNFPVHFFDALLPGHPTFGLDLMGAPDPALAEAIEKADDPTLRAVYLPAGPAAPEPLRWAGIDGFGTFLAQVLDTGLNWRDTMQMEMPGFRERVCHIRLDETEGGLNLSMKADAVQGLMKRGAYAGESFSRFSFPLHRFTRYLTLMQMLEVELKGARERFGYDRESGDDPRWFRDRLSATAGDGAYPWQTAQNPEWCRDARAATQALLDLTSEWGAEEPPPSLGFDRPGQTPTPRPALRIVPPV